VQITPPASPAPHAEAFRRRGDDAMLLGVCSGVARALGLAPVWIRLGTLAFTAILPALGVLVYALLGVVVRRDDGRLALGGEPQDSRETVVGWGLVALAAYGATTADSGLLLPHPRPLLLIACAAAAAVVAQAARGRGACDASVETVEHPTQPTLPAPPAPGDEPAPPAPAPGPSLFWIGAGVLVVVALLGVLVAPAAVMSAGASRTVVLSAGFLGTVALIGVVAAIIGAGRRHAGGLLALSLAVGLIALGLGSIHDQIGSQPAIEWLYQRVADLLWLNR
jgi:phage shock protein PspC (stress-responsive transcriptional regulator)